MTPGSRDTAGSDALLDRLGRLHGRTIDLGLDRVLRFLDRLGRPQDRLSPVVHVAGTNGKGSTIAFLRAMLEAAGRRVHVYTSPHLVRFHERIRLAGDVIGEDALADVLARCEAINADDPITFFEVTTAAAFLAFAETPADILLLETGMGGRLDATNVVARPALTVITPVDLDHCEFLGGTIAAIAAEKAGILKPGVPAVIGAQGAEAGAVIAARAAALGAPLHRLGTEWAVCRERDRLHYSDAAGELVLPVPALPGAFQTENAGAAIAAARLLPGFGLDAATIAAGLRHAEWPARLQRLTGPLAARLPAGWELWLDGGHNPSAGRALAETAEDWRDRPLHLVFGMLATKPPAAFLAPLAPHVSGLVALDIAGAAAAHAPDVLRRAAVDAGIRHTAAAPNLAAALDAVGRFEGPARVLICGSLALAGQVLAAETAAQMTRA
ncbi:MAG: folylpolyglutamate synthase/dihydrofolate synthase family protein [Alphaproteobacteria bacterium]